MHHKIILADNIEQLIIIDVKFLNLVINEKTINRKQQRCCKAIISKFITQWKKKKQNDQESVLH